MRALSALRVGTLDGAREVLRETLTGSVPLGRSEVKLRKEFPWVGEFRAQAFSAAGLEIGVEDYIFVVYPVIEETAQEVQVSREGKLRSIPADGCGPGVGA